MNKHTQTKDLITAAKHVIGCFNSDMIERLFFTIGAAKAYSIATAVEKLRDAIAKAEGEMMP